MTNQPKVEIKNHKPLTYRYYDYLKKNHYGKENGISRSALANIFGVSLETQKRTLAEINNSDIFPKLVSTSGSIYICRTVKECKTAYNNEIYSGLARILKGKKMAQKVAKNGQFKIQVTKECKELFESFVVEE